MKRVIKAESDSNYSMNYKHIIYDEDNMGFMIENYLVPKLQSYYGFRNVSYDNEGIHIDAYGKAYNVQIEEMPEPIANFEWFLYINGENINDIQATDSGEYFYSRTLELIEDYINEDDEIESSENTKYFNKQPITSARDTLPDTGTTWYKASYDEILDALQDSSVNPWVLIYFNTDNFNAINFKHNLWGSFVEGDDLYICVTDGYDIEINGEMVDPESAAEIYGLDELTEYIESATPEFIRSKITEDELDPIPFNKLINNALDSGWSFTELIKYAIDAGLDVDEL